VRVGFCLVAAHLVRDQPVRAAIAECPGLLIRLGHFPRPQISRSRYGTRAIERSMPDAVRYAGHNWRVTEMLVVLEPA
jgi:hypothetical protein